MRLGCWAARVADSVMAGKLGAGGNKRWAGRSQGAVGHRGFARVAGAELPILDHALADVRVVRPQAG